MQKICFHFQISQPFRLRTYRFFDINVHHDYFDDFQNSYLDSDPEIAAVPQEKSPYANYNIRGIDHRLDMGFLWVWPWENAVRVNITEKIPRIDGRVKGLKADEVIAQQGQDAIYPPDWPEMTYRALLVRENGQWKIRNLTPVQ